MSKYDEGAADAEQGSWNNLYEPFSQEYQEYSLGYYETAVPG